MTYIEEGPNALYLAYRWHKKQFLKKGPWELWKCLEFPLPYSSFEIKQSAEL